MKKFIAFGLALALALGLAACSNGGSGAGTGDVTIPDSVTIRDTDALRGRKIGCALVYKGDEWCASLGVAIEAIAKQYGLQITCEDSEMNDEVQTKLIENMVANGVELILVDPVTKDGCTEALMKAVEKDIPVIIFDNEWSGSEDYAETVISWDQYDTGVKIGEYFLDYVRKNNGGKATIVELGTMISSHCHERFEGLHDTIDKADDVEVKVIGRYDAQANRETAYNIVSSIVDPYDFVISDIDNGAHGAVSALQAAGNTRVKVLSMGGYGAEPSEAVHANDTNYLAFLNVDAWQYAALILEKTAEFFEGKTLDKLILFPTVVVDHTNAEQYWNFQ